MESNARYLLVGCFALISISLAFILLIWIGGSGNQKKLVEYPVVFTESINGISIGSEVQFLGVPVGTVSAMQLQTRSLDSNHSSQEITPQVKVTIAIDPEVPINNNTQAVLQLQGVTGLAIVELVPGKPGSNGSEDDTIIIKGTGSLITRLSNSGENITENLSAVLNSINQLLSTKNRQSIEQVLNSTALISEELTIAVKQINMLSSSVEQKTLPELTATLENVNNLSQQLSTVISNNDAQIQNFMSEGLGSVNALSDQFIVTLTEIETLVEQLQQQPSSVFYQEAEYGVEIAP